jgi:asparagine synthase (glutamine-hydrolysing)
VYDAYNKPGIKIELPEAIEETEKIFKKAFNYRMVADVPVGVFLSAGYDSSCVTALLQKDSTSKIRTFTIGTTDKLSDEAPLARQIADHLGTDHTEYYCTPEEAKAIIPILADYFDEPFADSSAVPTILVSRLARKNVTVALSADGGDEIFGGYPKYQFLNDLQKRLSRMPSALRSTGSGMMGLIPVNSLPVLNKNKVFLNKYSRLKSLLKNPTLENVFLSANQLFTKAELTELMNDDFKQLKTPHTSKSLEKEFYDPFSYMMAIDYETYLTDDIMQKVDRASMSIGLESREPFLDQNVIDWAARLPVEYKVGPGKNKYILKQIVHKYIPREMMERPKKGFTIPVAAWLKNDFRELVYDKLGDDFIKSQGLFRIETIRQLRDGFYTHGKVPAEKIWYLLMFQLWYEKWLKN